MKTNIHLNIPKFYTIIFDFDGVIVDSENYWDKIENPYIRKLSSKWHDDDYSQLTGMGLAEVHKLLVSKYDFPISQQQYFEDYEKLALTLYGKIVQPIQDIRKFLDLLVILGVKVGIASSSKPTWINIALKRHNLDGYFSEITTLHDIDVINGKPAPDVYLMAASKLFILDLHKTSPTPDSTSANSGDIFSGEGDTVGSTTAEKCLLDGDSESGTAGILRKSSIATNEVIVIEDSTNGVRAAKAAGMFCIGLDVNNKNGQDLSQADLIVSSYKELIELLG